jgi:uncharacterized protein YdeI (YjbR/CyaY-like superfamily)
VAQRQTEQRREVLAFTSSKEWKQWLAKSHDRPQGIWLRFFKKDSGVPSVRYEEALDEALCYGWIDGQLQSYDDKSWLRKFTPRRSNSLWSKRNIEHVQRLMKAGRMKSSGMKEIEEAQSDGRWMRAYDPGSTLVMPTDFLKRLSKRKKAKEFFDTLNKANTYAIAWRLQTAKKPETREKRLKTILVMLAKGEKLHD